MISDCKASLLWPVLMAKSLKNIILIKLEEFRVTPLEALATLSKATQSLFQASKPLLSLRAVSKSLSPLIKTSFNFRSFAIKSGKALDTPHMTIMALDRENYNHQYENKKSPAQVKV